ncbi:helix-turn-helix domain-containing protein [Trinickia diaoshuihuensis]|uniref:AlbA family DNA-binding domain-containing protein n=1 Tax=Trinickia diaoshuihuensis TaxID=2292265 RepID=UPI000E274EEA|nr:ATP-binding protein [Trinickia diaoshuihuensis]
MQKEILDLIFAGESETLEFKSTVPDPRILASLISSFANTEGGQIVVGVKEPPEIVGVDGTKLRRVYDAALKRLAPAPKASLAIESHEGHAIAVIQVERSSVLVKAEGVPFVRKATMTQPMPWNEMVRDLTPQELPQAGAALVDALNRQIELLEKQDKKIEEMRAELRNANSPKAKWTERAYGIAVGVVGSIIAAAIWALGAAHP